MVRLLLALVIGAFSVTSVTAHAEERTFDEGSLIIPMDTTYQDYGIFKAFGLVYALLKADVPVSWVIKQRKASGESDFVASAVDIATDAVITDHGYRAGPFVIAAADVERALPIIELWKGRHVTTVHMATTAFSGFVSKQLVAAPTIAVFTDGNQGIAFGYLNAAGIPDSLGQPWPGGGGSLATCPDALTVAAIAGPTTESHEDGALFDDAGNPAYCQIMTMHWGVNSVVDEVVAEMRAFLAHPTHLFAECQAVNALENSLHGKFLTPNGFLIAPQPASVSLLNADYPFAQMDGAFATVGGSEPAYSLPPGDTYKDQDIVMVTAANSAVGTQDIWMTGFLDGQCQIDSAYGTRVCAAGVGKVSYLGGHQYDTKLPLSTNPKSQGTRLFLNSLFEADCATAEGQPRVTITKTGPAEATSSRVTYELTVTNFGPATIVDVAIEDHIPDGTVVDAATEPYALVDGTVTWPVGNLGPGDAATVSITLLLSDAGLYRNTARTLYKVGVTARSADAEAVETVFGGDADDDDCIDTFEETQGTRTDTADTDGDDHTDCADICPTHFNPAQNLMTDPLSCGACGTVCAFDHAVAGCEGGACVVAGCEEGWADADGEAANGCEVVCVATGDDDNCDGVDNDCNGAIDDGWTPEACGVGSCATVSACVAGELRACVPLPAGHEGAAQAGSCNNGFDDDCDGLADDADPACRVVACATDSDCDDGDACTTDRCDAAVCVTSDACGGDVGGDATDAGTTTPDVVEDVVDMDTTADAGAPWDGSGERDITTSDDTSEEADVSGTGADASGTEADVAEAPDAQVADGQTTTRNSDSGCGGGGTGPGPLALVLALAALASRRRAARR